MSKTNHPREKLAAQIRFQLLEGHCCPTPSVTSRLPFPYHWIPGDVRMWLGRMLFQKNLKRLRSESRFPRAYADNQTDRLITEYIEPMSGLPRWDWPQGARCALVVSHDVDTAGQTRGIEYLRKISEARGIRGTFSFVGETLEHYESLIRDLRAAGHEIALHDLHHDNRVAFMDTRSIVARLSPLREKLAAHGIRGFRSPSWYTSPALWSALRELGFAYDMSVLDSWPFFDPARNFGVASLFPFLADGLAILPNTVPYDDTPWFCGYPVQEILAFWKPKLDWIAANHGLIMINAHPDRWWSGNARAAEMLGRTLDDILEHHEPVVLRGIDAAHHVFAESARGAMSVVEGTPELQVPRHDRATVQRSQPRKNPMLTPPQEFLR